MNKQEFLASVIACEEKDGMWQITHVCGNVWGDVRGNIYGSLWGDVRGNPDSVEPKPEELAKAFCDYTAEQQAIFFDEISRIVETEWDIPFIDQVREMQMDVSPKGVAVMVALGADYALPVPMTSFREADLEADVKRLEVRAADFATDRDGMVDIISAKDKELQMVREDLRLCQKVIRKASVNASAALRAINAQGED